MSKVARTPAEILERLDELKVDRWWVYRGQPAEFKLLPRVGREEYYLNQTDDDRLFNLWRKAAYQFVRDAALDDWDWLVIAQHHGFATRLLDWSKNPLIAAYFAVEDVDSKVDAVLHCCSVQDMIDTRRAGPFAPEWEGVWFFRPRAVVPRVAAQQAILSIHQPAHRSLEEQAAVNDTYGLRHEMITIPANCRYEFRKRLQTVGVDRAAIYHDLDAISTQAAWEMQHIRSALLLHEGEY